MTSVKTRVTITGMMQEDIILLYIFGHHHKMHTWRNLTVNELQEAAGSFANVVKVPLGLAFSALNEVLIKSVNGTNRAYTVKSKFFHEYSQSWRDLKNETDWRDAFNIAKLQRRKLYLSVAPMIREAPDDDHKMDEIIKEEGLEMKPREKVSGSKSRRRSHLIVSRSDHLRSSISLFPTTPANFTMRLVTLVIGPCRAVSS